MVLRLTKLMWYNTKILLDWNMAAAIVLMILAPFIFSFNLLEYKEVAKVSELYFSIMGIILFSYIVNIESQERVMELVNTRAIPYVLILVFRKLLVTLIAFIMIMSVLGFAKLKGSVFPLWEMTAGVLISTVYLGSIAYSITNLTNQISSGYIIAFAYYLMEYTTKGKYTGSFFLFSLIRMDFTPKYYLLTAAIVIFIINLLYINNFKSKLNQINE